MIRQRRSELGMSQGDLAAKVGVDRRQIRRYEAGETQPTLSVAKTIARALGITIDELAGDETHRIDLTGDWWACWQSWKDGVEVILELGRRRVQTPVLLVTGAIPAVVKSAEVLARAHQLNILNLLIKPVHFRQLSSALEKALAA